MINVSIKIDASTWYVVSLEHVVAVKNSDRFDSAGIVVMLMGGHEIFLPNWTHKQWDDLIEQMQRSMAIVKPIR